MAAELRLGVAFDLVYFRQQLDKLSRIAASEFTAPIKIRLDRKVVDQELNNLQRAFSRRTFNIRINDSSVIAAKDNVATLSRDIETLKKSLAQPIVVNVQYKKSGDIPGRGVGAVNRGVREAVGSQSIVEGATRKDLQDLYKFAREAEIPFEQLKNQAKSKTEELRRVLGPAFANIGEDIKAGIAAGLADANSELAKIASSMADTLLTTLKTQLGIASPSKETAKLGKFAGQGFANGFVTSMVQAERQMARAIRSSVLGAIKDGLGSLPGLGGALVSFERQLAAGIQVAVRKAMREGIKAAVGPGLQGGALGAAGGATTGAVIGGGKALGGAAMGGLAKLGAGGALGIASQMGRLTIGDTTGLTTFVQETVSQVIDAALSTGGQGALVGAAAVGGVAGAAGFTSGTFGSLVTQVATAVRNRVLAALVTVSTGEVNSIVQVMVRDVTNTLFQGIQRRIRAAMAQMPAINWEATLPTRGVGIGPGSAGRALPGAPTPGALPGTSYFDQKLLLGDLLDPSLKIILRDAANAFVDQFRSAMNAAVRSVNIRDLGTTIRGALPPGAPPPSRPMLPAAGGSGGYFSGGRRPGGGFVPPDGFPSDGMLGGPGGPKSMLSLDYYRNAFKYAEALKVAQASMSQFTASQVPLLGGLKNIASEFGMATQQVLLYGTAYKGLAFVTSLPGQLLNAAKGQQQYNNALQVATQTSGTYAKELLFVDNVQRAFGLNLQTTRDGFVRLYASMSPAGFDSGSIERLFTGISAATAALQLTPDKAERVIYAFGQMASKGQVMSEELKGQLGDVLPGALSIFADAAGKSIQEFNKDLEDGIYTGQTFRDLMTKVTDELITRFGTGAQAAGRSIQGLTNTIQGDFQRTLESFAPLADSAAQAILVPLGQALRQLSISAQIAMGEVDRLQSQIADAKQIVIDLKLGGATPEQIKAAEQNVGALEARLEIFNERLKDPAVAQQAQEIRNLAEEFSKAGQFVLNLAEAVGAILAPAFSFLGQNLTGIIGTVVPLVAGFAATRLAAIGLTAALTAVRSVVAVIGFVKLAVQLGSLTGAMTQAGVTTRVLSGIFNALGVSTTAASVGVIGVRTAVIALAASTGIGLLVAGLGLLAGAFLSVGDSAKQAAEKSKQAIASLKDSVASGNVEVIRTQLAVANADANDLEQAIRAVQGIQGGRRNAPGGRSVRTIDAAQIPASARRIFERQGVEIPAKGEFSEAALINRANAARQSLKAIRTEASQSVVEAEARRKRLGLNVPSPTTPTGVTAPTGAGEAKTAKSERESQVPQLQLRLELSKKLFDLDMQLAKAQLDNNIAQQSEIELSKKLTELEFERRGILLERIPDEEKALKIQENAVKKQQEVLESQQKLQLDLNKEYAKTQDSIEKILLSQEAETGFAEKYKELVLSGVNPALAKTRIEVTKRFAEEAKSLDLQIKQQEVAVSTLKTNIELAKLKKNLTPVEQLELTNAEKKLAIVEDALAKSLGLRGQLPQAIDEAVRSRQQEEAPKPFGVTIAESADQTKQELDDLTSSANLVITAANGIGDSFGQVFTDILSGAKTWQEGLGGIFRSVASLFADLVAQILAKSVALQIIGLFLPGAGSFAGGAGFGSQTTLPTGTGIGAGNGIIQNTGGQGFGTFGPNFGFRQFATGGVVTGPTLGLVGEGRFNEAVVPLPNGKSIPVDLGNGAGNNISTNIVVNVNNGQASSQVNGSNGQAFGREIEGAVRSVILKESRPGGIIYNQR